MSDFTPGPGSERDLLRHPLTPDPFVRSFMARAARLADGGLLFRYALSGDLVRLRIPPPGTVERRDGLWQYTCCEAFVALAGETAYREFNFSPSGQWAAFAFADYRRRQPTAEDGAAGGPDIKTCLSPGRFELAARLAAHLLPREAARRTLHIGLAAVVESADTVDGPRSYWALRHGAGQPDFHLRETFVLELPAP